MTDRNSIPTIGVLAGWQFYRTATNLSYLAPLFRGISRAAQELGCNLLLGCGIGPSASPMDPLRPAWPVQSPEADFVPVGPWNTDGLIIANPLHSEARSAYIRELRTQGFPVLFIAGGEDGPTIMADNRGGILEAMDHLVEHGHRQIAFIAGTRGDMNGDSGQRLRAYQSALAPHGLDTNPDLIAYGQHVYAGGYAAMQALLERAVPFTAVMASNDESALGAMQALKEAGRRVPEDVAVIGFDNRLEGVAHTPRLSSVHVPLFDLGFHALARMEEYLRNGTALPPVLTIPNRLIARDSCGCSFYRIKTPSTKPARTASLAEDLAETIHRQAHSLTGEQCLSFCTNLAESFSEALRSGNHAGFEKTLGGILQVTIEVDDDAHIWQDALSMLGQQLWNSVPVGNLGDLLDGARLSISAAMQRQHRQYVLDERWDASRLSLLTARLLTALDETQVYETLARHIPDLDIHTARLVLFEPEGDDPCAWSIERDALQADRPPVRFSSREFPPPESFPRDHPFLLTLIPLVDPSGQLGFMVFGVDHVDLYGAIVQQVGGALNTARLYRQATEGRRLAEEADRMKSRFLSTISHELRTPLSLVVGLSAMMLRASDEGDVPLPDATLKDIERIHTYAQHLGGLIGDVIDLATSQAGQLQLNNAYVDLGQALRMIAESGGQLAADKGLAWDVELPESGPWVWGDQTRLRQVALNLINNAIKFTSKGGVRLRLEAGADSVTVEVQDTGLGISLEDQQVIFDEFRRSDRTIARGYGGLGLGLAISKRLVEMHGGTIAVRSSGEDGAGSTFSFTLPTMPAPVEQLRSTDKLSSSEQSVLVLTNRPDTSERLCEHLTRRGFKTQVTLIKRNQAWRAQLTESHPDSIILDLSTDPALGWETLKEIKSSQVLAGIPVLFFSSSQAEGTLLELDYITKPIEISELTRALDHHWLMAGSMRSRRTILVVDDEPTTLEMHARIVQAHSASNRLLKARDGREALEILHRESVDLILLDLQMPEMDGFEVLEAMRSMESTRNIPVIVVTGKILSQAEMSHLNQGVAAVLGKGLFSMDETIAHIGAALDHKRRLSMETQRLVRSAMAFVHENFAEALSRRQIAQHVGITEDYLTFCFRQELGTTPIEYLHRYRINQAKRLLKESRQTITEIALSVGFSDSGYFSRIFRRETGQSPEPFRRS